METKKSAKGNLERRKSLYIMTGLAFVLTICYAGVELFAKQDSAPVVFYNEGGDFLIEQDVLSTDQTPPEPIQQQPQQPQDVIIQIVDDNIQVNEHIFIDVTDNYTPIGDPIEIPHPDVVVPEEPPVIVAEKMCEFPGGQEALYKYLKDNLIYPETPRITGIQGTVVVEFVVGKSGKVSDVKVVVPLFHDCDKEAIRVVQGMPNWKPAEQMGKKVAIYYKLPIRFVLN